MTEVTDDNVADFVATVVGRTIVSVEREPDSKEPWPQGDNRTSLTLDDGRVVTFSGWGYDAYGLNIEVTGLPSSS